MDGGEDRDVEIVETGAHPDAGRIPTASLPGAASMGALAGEEVAHEIGDRPRSTHVMDAAATERA